MSQEYPLCPCERPHTDEMIECEQCQQWLHFDCANIKDEKEAKETSFTCSKCKQNSTIETITPPTSPSTDEIDYEVERIIRHRGNEPREFLVKFAGYPEPEWVVEENLEGCFELLTNYIRSVKIRPTAIAQVIKFGADTSKGGQFNRANWPDAETTIQIIETYKKTYPTKTELDISIKLEHEKPEQKDEIRIYKVYNHAVVTMTINETAYIADGGNFTQEHGQIFEKVEEIFGDFDRRYLKFMQQTKIDHCASSAAAITIEMRRLYQDQSMITDTISANNWILNRIKGKLHKEDSQKIENHEAKLNNLIFPTCPKCGIVFKTKSRRPLTAHRLTCK